MKTTDVRFLCDACGGRLSGNADQKISGVKIDSRAAGSGDLFICIVGEKTDGHLYAGSAYENGCRAFLVTKDIEERDYRDSHREISPLKQAEDAVLVDSSDMTIDEVVSTIIGYCNK